MKLWQQALLVTLTAILAGGAAYWWATPEASPVTPTAATPTTQPAVSLPPVATITESARKLELITWEFATTVTARRVSDRWYGDVVADVRGPVTYKYGVDLATLRSDSILFDQLRDQYVFLVQAPRRLAVEFDLAAMEQSLETSGVRVSSLNQGKLEDARKDLAAQIETLELSPQDQQRLNDISREQLEAHLARVTGKPVRVRFVAD